MRASLYLKSVYMSAEWQEYNYYVEHSFGRFPVWIVKYYDIVPRIKVLLHGHGCLIFSRTNASGLQEVLAYRKYFSASLANNVLKGSLETMLPPK